MTTVQQEPKSGGDPWSWSWTRWRNGVRVEYGALIHSCIAVCLCLGILGGEAPDLRFWTWPETWFSKQETASRGAQLTCAFGFSYFVLDSIFLAGVRTLPRTLRGGFLLHHLICGLGLLGPLWYGRDSTIVLFGYLLGELSNPPRVAGQLFAAAGDPGRAEFCDQLHYGMFLALRALSGKLVFEAFLPSAELWTTRVCIVFLVLFTGITIGYYLVFSSSDGGRLQQQQQGQIRRKQD